MSYCPECGAEVVDDAKYCADCGTSLDGDEPSPTVEEPIEETAASDRGWLLVGVAVVLAIVPAFVAYAELAFMLNEPPVWAFFLGVPVFAWLLYRGRTFKGMIGGLFFYLAIEAFLTPAVFLVYSIGFAADQEGARALGAALGGGILLIGSFLVAVPLGIVFYLLYRRLTPEGSPETSA